MQYLCNECKTAYNPPTESTESINNNKNWGDEDQTIRIKIMCNNCYDIGIRILIAQNQVNNWNHSTKNFTN